MKLLRGRFTVAEWKKKKLPHSSFWILLTLICGLLQTLSLGAAPALTSLSWEIFSLTAHFASSFICFVFFPAAALLAHDRGSRGLYRFVVSSAFIYLVLLVANTLLYSTMGFHLNVALSMLFTGRWIDFVTTLRATEIPVATLFKIVAAIGVSAPLTQGLHHVCRIMDELYVKNPPRLFQILLTWSLCLAVTIAYQALAASQLDTKIYLRESRASSFTPRIFEAPESSVRFKIKMKVYQPQDEYPKVSSLDSPVPRPQKKKQNIFYLIFETLRGDFVTSEIMPNLFSFKNREISFPVARSNSNATHVSWDAIYLSSLPLYWGKTHTRPTAKGSIPFNEFKKAGFKIHVFTTGLDSTFWDAKRKYFGDSPLYDSYFEANEKSPSGTDKQSLEAIKEMLLRNGGTGKNLYIINIDSAHHDYFWPADFPPRFLPFANLTSNLSWKYSQELAAQVKNKYLNSLFYVDTLLGDFFQFLETKKLYDDSTFAIIGDHGEEFLEKGFFAHGSSLYNPQVNAGIYLKIPGVKKEQLSPVISQVDVLPTLLDSVGAYRQDTFEFLEGQSVLNMKAPEEHFAVSFSSEGTMTPFRGVLSNQFGKLFFELERRDPLNSTQLTVTELLDNNDQPLVDVHANPNDARKLIQQHFLKNLKAMRFLEELKEL